MRVVENFFPTSGQHALPQSFSMPTSDPDGSCAALSYDLWCGVILPKFLAMRTMPHVIECPRVMLVDGSANYIPRETFSRIGRAELQSEYAQKICAKVAFASCA